ncbi:MAG TPA: ribosome-associated translation inhibitor RaiA [Phycisphaerales bacterium]|nr:ribosome-associated translation inhibitor RaiA [Phycisphaerales bacterium]
MRIDVIGKHLEITDAIRDYAHQKAERLTKIFDGTQQIRFYLEQTKDRAGDFKVEVAVDVVKHQDFIATSLHKDIYAAMDDAVDKAQRQLRDYKEKLRLR